MGTTERVIAIWAGTVLLGGVFVWWRMESTAEDNRGPLVVSGVLTDEEHLVTPEMQRASEAMADRISPSFVSVDQEGRTVDSSSLVGDQPIFVVFIKDGCPCSTSAEPFFARLHRAYGDQAAFLGVIDGDSGVASRWVEAHGTPYPVLADPDLDIVRRFEVRNSAYVALIDREGNIEHLWPGYSEGILREMSARLASLTGLPEAEVGASAAPELPYSGCPFPEINEDVNELATGGHRLIVPGDCHDLGDRSRLLVLKKRDNLAAGRVHLLGECDGELGLGLLVSAEGDFLEEQRPDNVVLDQGHSLVLAGGDRGGERVLGDCHAGEQIPVGQSGRLFACRWPRPRESREESRPRLVRGPGGHPAPRQACRA